MHAEERYSHRISAAQDWILKSMNGVAALLVAMKIFSFKTLICVVNVLTSCKDL